MKRELLVPSSRYRELCLKLMAELVENKQRIKMTEEYGYSELHKILTAKNAVRQDVIDALNEIFKLEDAT